MPGEAGAPGTLISHTSHRAQSASPTFFSLSVLVLVEELDDGVLEAGLDDADGLDDGGVVEGQLVHVGGRAWPSAVPLNRPPPVEGPQRRHGLGEPAASLEHLGRLRRLERELGGRGGARGRRGAFPSACAPPRIVPSAAGGAKRGAVLCSTTSCSVDMRPLRVHRRVRHVQPRGPRRPVPAARRPRQSSPRTPRPRRRAPRPPLPLRRQRLALDAEPDVRVVAVAAQAQSCEGTLLR